MQGCSNVAASQVLEEEEVSASYLVLCPITCFLLLFQAEAEDANTAEDGPLRTQAEAEVGRWNAARQTNMCLVNFATTGTLVPGSRGRGGSGR